MTDEQLVKIKQLCCDRYLWRRAGSLRSWIASRGTLSNAQAAPVNVHGIGIAFKRVDGRITDTLCIQVAVLRKMSPADVASTGATMIDREIDGVPIDVVETGPLVLEPQSESTPDSQAAQIMRPLRPGCSISHADIVTGTLGAFCRSRRDSGQVFMLSCRHVLAGFGARLSGLPIFQPGGSLGGPAAAAPVAGAVAESGIVDSTESPPRYSADAAIAPLAQGVEFSPDNLGIGPSQGAFDLLRQSTGNLLRPDRYIKFGRTTGLTEGQLSVVRRDLVAVIGGSERQFVDQFVVRRLPGSTTPMCDPGDSGSMMFHKDSRMAAGLVIGAPIGLDNDEEAVVSPLGPILRELDIELI